MRVMLAASFVATVLAAGPGSAQEPAPTETKETLESLPPAVRKAVEEQSRGATLRGVAREVKDGVTLFEVETTVNGRTKNLMLDLQGKMVSVEEQTTLGEIPEPARAAILRAVNTGKLVLVEKMTKNATTFFEKHIDRKRKLSEVKMDTRGQPIE
jgi:hypothetical protein